MVDLIANLGIYKLSGNTELKSLLSLPTIAGEERKLAILINLDWSKPWMLMKSLNNWLSVIRELVNQAGFQDLPNLQKHGWSFFSKL